MLIKIEGHDKVAKAELYQINSKTNLTLVTLFNKLNPSRKSDCSIQVSKLITNILLQCWVCKEFTKTSTTVLSYYWQFPEPFTYMD